MNTLKKKKELELTVARLTGEITVFSKQISQMHKAMVEAIYNRGVAYSKKGDTVPAIADLNLVVKSDLPCPEAYFYRGVSYLQRKEWIKAKQDFTLARRGKVDIAHLFQEQKFELPSDIVHLLKDG